MATLPPRGRGGSRGGRGRGTPYRGVSTPRGNFAGARDSRSPPASAPIGLRGGHNGGFRGGAQRGGTYTRGDNSRGQGDRTYVTPSYNASVIYGPGQGCGQGDWASRTTTIIAMRVLRTSHAPTIAASSARSMADSNYDHLQEFPKQVIDGHQELNPTSRCFV